MAAKRDIRVFHECNGMHKHSYPQILSPIGRAMEIRIGDEEYTVSEKALCFIPADTLHECSFCGQLLVINLHDYILHEQNTVLLNYPLVISLQGRLLQLVGLIQEELHQEPNSRSIHYLYSYLYSKLMENCAVPSIRYINEHYDMPITVSQLAEMENYSVTYYNGWFKQITGVSPSLYLRHLRISKAKELLEVTDHDIIDIAIMVGYSSNSTFTRAFHDVTGMSPNAYRKSCAQKIS